MLTIITVKRKLSLCHCVNCVPAELKFLTLRFIIAPDNTHLQLQLPGSVHN